MLLTAVNTVGIENNMKTNVNMTKCILISKVERSSNFELKIDNDIIEQIKKLCIFGPSDDRRWKCETEINVET